MKIYSNFDNTNDYKMQLPLIPLEDIVVFPYTRMALIFDKNIYQKRYKKVVITNAVVVTVAQRYEDIDFPDPDDMYNIGTAVKVIKIESMLDDNIKITVEGLYRAKIQEIIQNSPYYLAYVIELRGDMERTGAIEALISSTRSMFKICMGLGKVVPRHDLELIEKTDNPIKLSDLIVAHINLDLNEKQLILELVDPQERLRQVFLFISREVQLLQLRSELHSKVAKELGKTQREHFLRQELKTIQRELGSIEDGNPELAELKQKIDEAKLPEEAQEVAMRELKRMQRLHPISPEYSVARDYLEWLTSVPWNTITEDNLDIKEARIILDEDHYGLEKVKERILEYLAVCKLKGKLKGPILCFVGPPGVGKTSLGQSIARALGRKFVHMSLGGIRDEAEIRGHRRTYIGAMPGRIIDRLRRVGCKNPLFMLDEIDKIGQDFRGDPSSALLEVLDPEQNFAFNDHYLNVPYDLSQVMFITTANLLDPIPPALQDRMEVIHLAGYTEEEKLEIAKRYLLPKQLSYNGLDEYPFKLPDKTLSLIIRNYTREAGVRSLERKLAALCRKVARKWMEDDIMTEIIKSNQASDYLGKPQFFFDVANEESRIGVAIGMAWTSAGGDIIFIESIKMKGKEKLTLTGSLGTVMQESAQAALSYIRSNVDKLGLEGNILEGYDTHIHVPAGATPKDGPSAGITIAMSLLSLFTGRAVKNDIAFTGEITLSGRILPIGGVKEKVLAARRAGIKTIVLPENNKLDLDEIPDYLKETLEFKFVSSIMDVVPIALI